MSKANNTVMYRAPNVYRAIEQTYRACNPNEDYVDSKSRSFMRRAGLQAGMDINMHNISEGVLKNLTLATLDADASNTFWEILREH